MKVQLRPRALADLEQIRDYLLDQAGEAAAERVRRHLIGRIEALRRRPALGIATSHPAIRALSPIKYPYRIYFTVLDGQTIILHIRHTKRALPDLDQL